ncbi:hypothetical protein Naga_100098g15 [Nannochloropsis gaditana]|uniref:Uncharacterized protein n=1 Tax=Nannochloropsis gaditana TaxID=72520 RepID=W7TDM4_9STRA|nr:hypothetical protein Naga_100098g15 [Nannochloropsis gaditana]
MEKLPAAAACGGIRLGAAQDVQLPRERKRRRPGTMLCRGVEDSRTDRKCEPHAILTVDSAVTSDISLTDVCSSHSACWNDSSLEEWRGGGLVPGRLPPSARKSGSPFLCRAQRGKSFTSCVLSSPVLVLLVLLVPLRLVEAFTFLPQLPTCRHHFFFHPADPPPPGSSPLSTIVNLAAGGESGGAGPEEHMPGGASLVDLARRRFWRWTVWRRLYHSSVATVLKQQASVAAYLPSINRRRSGHDSTYTKPRPFLFSAPDAGPVTVASSSCAFNAVHLVTRAAAPEQKSLIYVNGTEVSGHLRLGGVAPTPSPRRSRRRDGQGTGTMTERTASAQGVLDPKAPLSLSLVGEFCIDKPAYLHIAPTKAGAMPLLWVTQFSITRRGSVSGINIFGQAHAPDPTASPLPLPPAFPPTSLSTQAPAARSSASVSSQVQPPPPSSLLLQDQSPADMPIARPRSPAPGTEPIHPNPAPEEIKLGFSFRWPNEVYNLPPNTIAGVSEEALLVADGFLMPGRSDGGLYVVQQPGTSLERVTSLTRHRPGWFYHKATWVDLLGPGGRPCLLTARATKPFFAQTEGELVLLLQPEGPFPLAEWNTPWQEVVLAKGPDVMFDVADLDPTDDVLEVFASEFFSRRLSLHRIIKGDWRTGRLPRVLTSEVLDDALGPAYSVVLADLRGQGRPSHVLVSSHECQYEGLVEGGSVKEGGRGSGRQTRDERLRREAAAYAEGKETEARRSKDPLGFSGAGPILESVGLTGASGRALSDGVDGGREDTEGQDGAGRAADEGAALNGGSLFAYEIPPDWRQRACWKRSTLATGFHVKNWGQINPGAPGFPYVFYPHRSLRGQPGQRPYILLAGDCSHAAYIYRPVLGRDGGGGDEAEVQYEPMAQINCGGTVGSLAVGHLPLAVGESEEWEEDDDGWAKIFIPNFDTDKVYAFSFGPEKVSFLSGLSPPSVPSEPHLKLEAERKARVAEEDEIVNGINSYAKTRGEKTKIG